ncbi:hypothetical protein [Gimesia maris]|uniref:hypothetical protein n=1 Tax=Gimesia maris TaxID=122 RepID=UPI0032EDBA1B
MENTNLFTQSDNYIEQFAADTKCAFLPYIDPIRSGINDGTGKRFKITYAEINANAEYWRQKNAGIEKPKVLIVDHDTGKSWTYKSGDKEGQPVTFHPYHNYKTKIWHSNTGNNKVQISAIVNCIRGFELHYMTAPKRAGKKLAYLDLDIHNDWQDDLDTAIAKVKAIFGDYPFWRCSQRGYNGWIKFGNAPTADKYNELMKQAEEKLKDIFAAVKIKTDVELKGHNGLAKLPYWNHRYPCYRQDEKDLWNQDRLDEFSSKPNMDFYSFIDHIADTHAKLDSAKVAAGYAYLSQFDVKKKKKAEAAEALIDRQPLEVASAFSVKPVVAPDIVPEAQTKKEAVKTQLPLSLRSSTPPATPVDVYICCSATDSLDDIRKITDAFERNRLFAFWCNRKAKRPLSPDELLALDYKYNIYNGDWQEGLNNRIKRYNDIAPFAANDFDPSKCGEKSQRPILDENIKEWKSKAQKFPKVAYGYCGSDENKKTIKVKRDTLIMLTAIIQTASKDNKDCPRLTIQSWWEELAGEGILPNWHTDTYIAVRSILVRYKLICVDHDCYWWSPDRRGQCKRIWIREQKEVGERNYTFPVSFNSFFPFLLHKEYNQRVIENEVGSTLEMTGKPPP